MLKKELRSAYLEKRLALSDIEYTNRNQEIANHFFREINLDGIKVIHIFIPMVKYKECNTWLIIERIIKEMPAIRFSVPRVNTERQLLENFYLESREQLKENKWGIEEPRFGEKTRTKDIDLVMVPLLAFDKAGHRVGYGKGYYDKLLSECRSGTLKIGVSFFSPIEKIEDVNELDVALDSCITPKKLFYFN